jgi:hypothetical protein
MTNGLNVCLNTWKGLAIPTVYHHEWPTRGFVPPKVVHAGCYGRARDGTAAWSTTCTGYIVFLGTVHSHFASLHSNFQRSLRQTEALSQQGNLTISRLIMASATVPFGTLSSVGLHMGEVQTQIRQRDLLLTI